MRRIELGAGEMPAISLKKNAKGENVRQPGSHIADCSTTRISIIGHLQETIGGLPGDDNACTPATFRAAGVSAAAVAGPFTVTLTDLAPKTGRVTGTEVIGVDGIHDHRVNKTIRIKIGIKDSNGTEPNYPVLVRLWLAGDSARECSSLTPTATASSAKRRRSSGMSATRRGRSLP